MVDYAKLTVANLRGILKERGIPSTGLTRKQQIVDRLEESDREKEAESNKEGEEEAELEAEDPAVTAEIPAVDGPADSRASLEDVTKDVHKDAPAGDEVTESGSPKKQEEKDQVESADFALPTQMQPLPVADAPPSDAISQPSLRRGETSLSQTPVPTLEQSLPATQQPASAGPPTESTQTSHSSTPGEEERRKRKRRSASPPVEAEAAAKKLKETREAEESVVLMEDVQKNGGAGDGEGLAEQVSDGPADADKKGDVMEVEEKGGQPPGEEKPDFDEAANGEPEASSKPEEVAAEKDADDAEKKHITDTEKPSGQSEAKDEPHDDKTANGEPETSKPDESAADKSEPAPKSPTKRKEPAIKTILAETSADTLTAATEAAIPASPDRTVAPALHPATSALYIRNFMRPLQPAALRRHLTTICQPPTNSSSSTATPPPSSPTDPPATTTTTSPLLNFHLDPIRTHCLVLFATPAHAARARAALHAAVWPPERARRPLWADFVPESEVPGWIAQEEAAVARGDGGRMGRRWEVAYEPRDDGDGVEAVFREVGAQGGGAAAKRDGAGVGAAQAREPPTGPRDPTSSGRRPLPPEDPRPALPPPRQDARRQAERGGRGDTSAPFVALDALFRSTGAKPKLYFLPAPAEVARERREALRAYVLPGARGGPGADEGEKRRITFEGEKVVDAGPDFESGGGGGGAGFGPGGGRRGGGPGAGGGGMPPSAMSRGGRGGRGGWRGGDRFERRGGGGGGPGGDGGGRFDRPGGAYERAGYDRGGHDRYGGGYDRPAPYDRGGFDRGGGGGWRGGR